MLSTEQRQGKEIKQQRGVSHDLSLALGAAVLAGCSLFDGVGGVKVFFIYTFG